MDEALYDVLWFCDEIQVVRDPQANQVPPHGGMEAISSRISRLLRALPRPHLEDLEDVRSLGS